MLSRLARLMNKTHKPVVKEEVNIAQVQFRVDREKDLKKFVKYLSHPGHIMWRNFLAGTFHGLGFALGTAVLLAFLGFIIKDILGQLPFFENLSQAVEVWLENNTAR